MQDSLLSWSLQVGADRKEVVHREDEERTPFSPPVGTLSPLEIRDPGKELLTLQGMTTAAWCLLPRNEVKRKIITTSGREGITAQANFLCSIL